MYILFDIGATNLRVGVSKDGSSVDNHKQVATPKQFGEAMALVKGLVTELVGTEEIRGAAGGVAGTFNSEKTELVQSRLSDWVGKPLREALFDIVQSPIRLENDTAVVGLGESHFGAGKNAEVMVYITVSTGIGGVKISGGKIDESAMGFEPGHQIINITELGLEGGGGLESYVSGTALQKKYGKIPSEIHDEAVWLEAAHLLAVGLYNTILHWSPHAVVLGGGVVVHADLDIAAVKKNIESMNKVFVRLPEIRKAALGDLGGLYGALILLKA